jgi:hypothetical protein
MHKDINISPDRLRQIIVEEVQRDTLMGKVKENMKVIRRDTLKIPIAISEDKSITFGTLMQYVDGNIISENESANIWSASVKRLTNNSVEGSRMIYEKLRRLVKGDDISVDKQTLLFLQQFADTENRQ